MFDHQVLREKELGVNTVSLPREDWDTWDPTLISEVSQVIMADNNYTHTIIMPSRDCSLQPTYSPH